MWYVSLDADGSSLVANQNTGPTWLQTVSAIAASIAAIAASASALVKSMTTSSPSA
jgi:hypothetical protein